MYMYVNVHVDTYVHVYECLYVCMYVCVYVCMHVWMDVCIYEYIYLYTCIHTHAHVHIYTYIYIHIHVYMYMYILRGTDPVVGVTFAQPRASVDRAEDGDLATAVRIARKGLVAGLILCTNHARRYDSEYSSSGLCCFDDYGDF